MKKKLAAILLCIGMVANMALPLVANDTEDFVVMQSEIGEDEEIGFLIPVEQQTEVPEGYIGIYTAEDLDNVRNDLDANYILMNDIDLSEYENWIPIGDITHESTYNWDGFFRGIFDGNGYTISNLTINVLESYQSEDVIWENYGLFSCVCGKDSLIKNLELSQVELTISRNVECASRTNLGAISGDLTYGTISNCFVSGTLSMSNNGEDNYFMSIGSVVGSCQGNLESIIANTNISVTTEGSCSHHVGGIIGTFTNGVSANTAIGSITVRDCINRSTIENEGSVNTVGGLIGRCSTYSNSLSYIENCINFSDVYSSERQGYGNRIGGIIGYVQQWGTSQLIINESTNRGTITSDYDGGGICGYIYKSETSLFELNRCYNSGTITVANSEIATAGGLIARIESDQIFIDGQQYSVHVTIRNSYNSGEIIGQSSITNKLIVGGLFGLIDRICKASIEYCYSLDTITTKVDASVKVSDGVIVGAMENSYSIVDTCYYEDLNTLSWEGYSSYGNGVDMCLIYGLPAEDLQKQSMYPDFDFDTVWEIGVTEGYPYPTLQDNPHNSNFDNYTVHEFNGNQYAIINKVMTWTEAKAYCENLGGHLVTITSQNEQDFIVDIILSQSKYENVYYLGATTDGIENAWHWVTNESFTYTNWQAGQPDGHEYDEDYVQMNTRKYYNDDIEFKWHDIANNNDWVDFNLSRGFICEWEGEDNPITTISTTFDTSAITLSEGETFDFAGIVSTTAEAGLEAVQIDIHNYEDGGIGITHIRKTNTDEEDPLTGNTFDLSAIPSFKGGDTLIGQTDNTITLSAGTSWKVYVYAKDTDGNTLGNAIVKRIDIVEKEPVSSKRITKDSPCTYENVFKAICQILEDKNDGYNEYAKYEWEANCKDKTGWYTDEFLLLCMATAWTESAWNHYESDGSVKVYGNTRDTGIMQLNTVNVITADWLIQNITEDWYYNLEYGMGNVWNAYKESQNIFKKFNSGVYNNPDAIARGAYCRYNAGIHMTYTENGDTKPYYWQNAEKTEFGKSVTNYGEVPSEHRFHFLADNRDTNFYKYYCIMKEWFNDNAGGVTGSIYKAYEVFCELYGNIDVPEKPDIPTTPIVSVPSIEQIETKINVTASLDQNIVKKGEKVTLTATITSTGKPLDKATLQWYGHEDIKTWEEEIPADTYTYDISYELDTAKYDGGKYRVYGAIAGITHNYDELSLTVVTEENTSTEQYYSMGIKGANPENNIYTVTNDSTITIDYGTKITGGGIYLKKDGVEVGNNIYGWISENDSLTYPLDISEYASGIYTVETYAYPESGGLLSGIVYEQLRIVKLPNITVNNKTAGTDKTISCNIANDIVFSSDWTNSDAGKCDIRWSLGLIGTIEKSNNSVSISQKDIAGIALDTKFTAYCVVYFNDGTEYTIPIGLKLYESNINNKEIEENTNSILEYKDNAFVILNKLLNDGSITQSEYTQRTTALNRAFEMATFAWYTDEDINYYRYKDIIYHKDTVYYGLPYTQGYNFYNGESVDQNTKTFYRYNDKNDVIENGGYSKGADSYNLNAFEQTTNKGGKIKTYLGNDCVAFSSIIWTGNGMPNGDKNKNFGTSELADNAIGKYGIQVWWEIDSTSKLRPGDILITTANRHAVVFLYFEECADGTKRAVCIEQGGGTAIHNNIASYIEDNLYTVHVSSWDLISDEDKSLESYKYYIVSAYKDQQSNKTNYCFRNGKLVQCFASDFNWQFGK